MTTQEIISWLLAGDVSIQYQCFRDLLEIDKPTLRKSIESKGWGRKFLSLRDSAGYWGQQFYMPKWTSTHYTLLDLKNLNIFPNNKSIKGSLVKILTEEKGRDGGIYAIGNPGRSDVCVNGMFLNYASYFQVKEEQLTSVIDFLLSQQMSDGGFNCHSNRKGAVHSSLHSTLSVLEGILEYQRNGYSYRLKQLKQATKDSQEFILMHRLFKSDKTGKIINPEFLRFHYPCRWHYDILRAMDYFQFAKVRYDIRMNDAIDVIVSKRMPEGLWKLASKYPGRMHFEMEQPGKPSRWNTLRALRILKYYGLDY
jgi:hypothetical protein